MFATAAPRYPTSAFTASAYRQVSVQTGVDSATPHQLVLLLLDGFQDSVAQARGAMQSGQLETKCRAIGRAVRIVEEGLRASLNHEGGGALAADLDALYRYVGVQLTKANGSNDIAALEECGRLLEPIRSAWVAIGAQAGAKA